MRAAWRDGARSLRGAAVCGLAPGGCAQKSGAADAAHIRRKRSAAPYILNGAAARNSAAKIASAAAPRAQRQRALWLERSLRSNTTAICSSA